MTGTHDWEVQSRKPTRSTDMATKAKAADEKVEDEVATEPVADGVDGEVGGKRTRRPGPKYALTKLDALPDNTKAERTSRQVYVELLQPITEDEDNWGEWFQVAEFNTVSGAKDAAKAIKAGDRDVPEGEWEFEYRRLTRENGDRYSILAARYLGK